MSYAEDFEGVAEGVAECARAGEDWREAVSDAKELGAEADAELARLQKQIDDLQARTIHSCHENCQRVECVQRRELARKDEQIAGALNLAVRYGGIDGAHHKAWVIDQMVRALTGDKYAGFVADAKAGEDGFNTYEWDEGIAP